MTISYAEAMDKLAQCGQTHLLRFHKLLSDIQLANLLSQIEQLDVNSILEMQKKLQSAKEKASFPDIEPASVLELSEKQRPQMRNVGEALLKEGKVGIILVAGGQGTRLGFDGPKGCFEIGPVTRRSLYEIHARKVLNLQRRYFKEIPFYIMTSQENDMATRRFFATHNYFGLSPELVIFFKQGMLPAMFPDGRIIMDRPDHIFFSPDGHGGVLKAMQVNGILEDMRKRGLSTLFYFQVDNPLVEIADPVFLGVHITEKADMSLKVCAKRDPEEGLGVVVTRKGRNMLVEYSELTKEQKHARDEKTGKLKFLYGSVAIHVFALDFLEQMTSIQMPLHIAHKKIPWCDDTGKTIIPDKPNGYKFEKFIFDVLPFAKRSVNLVFNRQDEFSPVKNAEGNDSPATTRLDMNLKYARWLEQAGVKVPRDENNLPRVNIEIDPCFANSAEELSSKLPRDFQINGDIVLA
jgi:UDP-N-acetylglucosamine/UDP-N-acetylgalactosamine diphosphorylase